jgi:hypothetical protein
VGSLLVQLLHRFDVVHELREILEIPPEVVKLPGRPIDEIDSVTVSSRWVLELLFRSRPPRVRSMNGMAPPTIAPAKAAPTTLAVLGRVRSSTVMSSRPE